MRPVPLSLEVVRNRQAIYRLFGALFLYPTSDRLKALCELTADEAGGFTFPLDVWQLLDRYSSIDCLQVEEEYTALFSVKPKAPPYESFYVDAEGFNRGWVSVGLDRAYRAVGLSASGPSKEPPDHVAVELEFMAYICSLEARAIEEQDDEAWERTVRHQAGFLDQHLGLWLPAFTRMVRESAPDSLYAAVAEAADAFVAKERERLRDGINYLNSAPSKNGQGKLQGSAII